MAAVMPTMAELALLAVLVLTPEVAGEAEVVETLLAVMVELAALAELLFIVGKDS